MVDLVGQAEVAGEAGDIDLVELSVQQMDALKTKKYVTSTVGTNLCS